MFGSPQRKKLPPLLTGQDQSPVTLYHFGRMPVDSFRPFTHFGTLTAAVDRLIQKDGIHLMSSEDVNLNGTVFYPVHLRIKTPLIVDDDCTWDSNGVSLSVEKHFSQQDRGYIGEVYQSSLTEARVRTELEQGGIYDLSPDENKNRQNLEKQRTIAVLESKGYDSIAYYNREEDGGSISWMNLRPQQVESLYGGPMTEKPCLVLPVQNPKDKYGLLALFNMMTSSQNKTEQPPAFNVSQLEARRWITTPEAIAEAVTHFERVQSDWEEDREQEKIIFQANIEIAAIDPERIAARVANGSLTIAAHYEYCKQLMADLASKPVDQIPEWQRPYLPEIRRLADTIQNSPPASKPSPAAIFKPV